jgi:hypothetical protein
MKRGNDHGSGAGGAWRDKSETPPGTVIMGSVLLGQRPAHDHDGDRRGGRRDHGSDAPGGCDAKSEAALPAARNPTCHKFRTDKSGNPGAESCGSYEESRRSWKYRRWGMARQVRNGPHSLEFHDHGILFIVWVDRFT